MLTCRTEVEAEPREGIYCEQYQLCDRIVCLALRLPATAEVLQIIRSARANQYRIARDPTLNGSSAQRHAGRLLVKSPR